MYNLGDPKSHFALRIIRS